MQLETLGILAIALQRVGLKAEAAQRIWLKTGRELQQCRGEKDYENYKVIPYKMDDSFGKKIQQHSQTLNC